MKKLIIGTLGLSLSALSFGQVWNEVGDAIQTLPGQMTIGAGDLMMINGSTHANNDVDLYCIDIYDIQQFRATTVSFTTMDTQLFLFRPDGVGVTFNDDAPSGGTFQSTITGAFVSGTGHYILGISTYDIDPVDAGNNALWIDGPFTAERAPDGPGAANPFNSWGGSLGETGHYGIALRGARYCAVPEPGTMIALGLGAAAALRRRRNKKSS